MELLSTLTQRSDYDGEYIRLGLCRHSWSLRPTALSYLRQNTGTGFPSLDQVGLNDVCCPDPNSEARMTRSIPHKGAPKVRGVMLIVSP